MSCHKNRTILIKLNSEKIYIVSKIVNSNLVKDLPSALRYFKGSTFTNNI